MKNYFILLTLALIPLLSFAQISMANNCPEKRSGIKRASIRINDIYLSHNTLFMGYYPRGSGKKKSLQINYGDRVTFAKFLGDEETVMEYRIVQYFDEMDGECLRTIKIRKIGGVKLR